MKKYVIWLILINLVFCNLGYAKVRLLSETELKEMSDLIVEVQVIKVEPTPKTTDAFGDKLRISVATLKIVKTIKGSADNLVKVEFSKIDDFVTKRQMVEGENQGPQFEAGQTGIAYLRRLSNGNYEAVGHYADGFKPK